MLCSAKLVLGVAPPDTMKTALQAVDSLALAVGRQIKKRHFLDCFGVKGSSRAPCSFGAHRVKALIDLHAL